MNSFPCLPILKGLYLLKGDEEQVGCLTNGRTWDSLKGEVEGYHQLGPLGPGSAGFLFQRLTGPGTWPHTAGAKGRDQGIPGALRRVKTRNSAPKLSLLQK